MQNKYLKFLLIALVIIFVIPQIALAAWWNPFSWGIWNRVFHFQQQIQNPPGQQNKTDQTAGWKTYTNTQYGFEIKYPQEYNPKEYFQSGDSLYLVSFSKQSTIETGGVVPTYLSVKIYNQPASLDDWLKQQGLDAWSRNDNFSIGGQKAIYLNNENEVGVKSVVIASYGGKTFRIENGDNINFNRFLSTFKFTTPVDPTAGWKTYTNDEYGFEFKYPSEFFYWDPKALIGDCNYNIFPAQCPDINDIVVNEQIAEGGNPSAVQNNISLFPKGEKTTINNTPYCLYKTGDPAAGNVYYDYYYATVKNQKCFVVRLVTRLANCGVYGIAGDKAYDDCINYNGKTYPQKLNQIISTFKFTKSK